jgi:hypothetical protein
MSRCLSLQSFEGDRRLVADAGVPLTFLTFLTFPPNV